jgi:serine/threonine protein kinase/tetratricopeptide (TPR) repeat protein
LTKTWTCPRCGTRIDPALWPEDHCPRCLIDADQDGGAAADADAVPPPEVTETTIASEPAESPDVRVGNYRLRQRVGVGGMGEVWEADQLEPVRRRVAFKVIKAGMDSKQVVARFEAERQALAMMDHPAVAKVFDAGTTPQGRPYFVMEFVRGVPITEHCDRHRLSTRERLELFCKVCEGVQHAHQKAIIHRDLKPSNVLVTEQEGKRLPKIIDFGVAKATARKLTEKTMFTELGVLIGTPEYMSPEQAELTGEGVDTRTDVYSLGVILYELLVGALPFDPKELRSGGFEGIRKKIREEEPRKPSTRLSTLGDRSTESARCRRVDLPTLQRQLRGDLDWITMKALEKDRSRRYGSPMELAADIGRYLADEPVLASPPSVAYRSRKFVRRHKVGVAAGLVVALAIVLGMAVAAVGFLRAKRAEYQAREEAETAQQVSEFMTGLFKGSDPTVAQGETLTVREVLDRGAKRLETDLADQPEVRARLLTTIGRVYTNLGLFENAASLQESALTLQRELLGNQHNETTRSMMGLGWMYFRLGRLDEAGELFHEAYETRRRVFGEDDPDTLWALHYTGTLEQHRGNLDEAERIYLNVLEGERRVLGSDDYKTMATVNNLADLYATCGRYDEAQQLHRQNLDARRRALGEDHPLAIRTMLELAGVLMVQGLPAEAESLTRKALERTQRVLPEEHWQTRLAVHTLACLVARRGEHAEAIRLLERLKEQQIAADNRSLGSFTQPAMTSLPGSQECEAIVAEVRRRAEEE